MCTCTCKAEDDLCREVEAIGKKLGLVVKSIVIPMIVPSHSGIEADIER